ncbi:MAG: serine/threonine protein kinase, partial [Planctomycetes bacterium]|nr:serine/threonine protein kinase [Planctomycetota bacterium]
MDRPPDSHSPDRVERHLDRGLALGFGKQPGPEPPSVLQRLAAVTGGSQMVSLRDPDHAAPEPLLKPLAPESGARAGKYVIQGELGSGGVGAVHRGHDQDLGRDVALKFLHDRYRDQPQFVQRFVEEAQIGGQLQHPGIVPVYDFGLADDRPFFAMKLVKGQTLAAALADRDSPADERTRFLGVFEQVCQTIAYAHARGVVHRDLKPANVMIGSFGEVQVVDWGMGKVLRSGGVADERRATDGQSDQPPVATVRTGRPGSHSVAGSVFGTPAYMAPEQARGDIEQMDERSDVFALGAILCEILTGHPPYSGTDEQVLAKAAAADCREAAGRLATCGAGHELIALTTRCLAATNRQRPRNAAVV